MSAKPRSTIKTGHDSTSKILGSLRIDHSSKKPKQVQNNKSLSSITFKEFVTESAWSHLIEIFVSICCFFGFLSTEKKKPPLLIMDILLIYHFEELLEIFSHASSSSFDSSLLCTSIHMQIHWLFFEILDFQEPCNLNSRGDLGW